MSITADPRLMQLQEWVRTALHRSDLQVEVASADASFRRYFRVLTPAGEATPATWIVMDAPPDKEDVAPYLRVADMLVRAGVNAPRVVARNLQQGYLLLSDLGNRTYLSELQQSSPERSDELYGDALKALLQMQRGCQPHVGSLPPYDATLLHREMQLFPDWFMTQHLQLEMDSATRAQLDAAFGVLSAAALAQPRVFVHRDYHSRNLMVTGEGYGDNPGVLDFQDAVHGPVTYDLVSLLRDCYIAWPLERVHKWVRQFRDAAQAAGFDCAPSYEDFLRWFDLMGVQRHLKAVGIFARLCHRDGKRGYLNDIPRTLDYIRQIVPRYAELDALGQVLARIGEVRSAST
jgi:N-acetylmuramate 1-kinase